MNRRTFFSRTAGLIVGAAVAPHIIKVAAPAPAILPVIPGFAANLGTAGTYGGITRSTYSFWRNQQSTILCSKETKEAYENLLRDDMRRGFEACQ